MNTHTNQRWLKISANVLILLMSLQFIPQVSAAEQDATYILKPHCIREGEGEDWPFGPIPAVGPIAETGGGRCDSEFEVENPETLKTDPLSVGDILDIDVIIDNPSGQTIKRARAWLSYDPNVLEGVSVDLAEVEPYILATPGEDDFDTENGYAKMELTSEVEDEPTDDEIPLARIQFRVKKLTPNGTVLSFHDAQPDGHTTITARDGDDEAYILMDEPGTLHVLLDSSDAMTEESSASSAPASSSSRTSAAPSSASSSFSFNFSFGPAQSSAAVSSAMGGNQRFCNIHADCGSDLCIAGVCQADPNKTPDGGACTSNAQCASNLCTGGICAATASSTANNRTAFSLLQVQNLRVTTQGTSIFLAWDALTSSQLKGYNVYYGTTSGRYIQRRTVPASATSLTIRSLSVGTTYYLAVRAINSADEESAFSNEVYVTVGDPSSSTAPLDLDTLGPAGGNPLGGNLGSDVPGETGVPTIVMITVLLSAMLGTLIASRRQYAALHS